jgi:hypothetical protein
MLSPLITVHSTRPLSVGLTLKEAETGSQCAVTREQLYGNSKFGGRFAAKISAGARKDF